MDTGCGKFAKISDLLAKNLKEKVGRELCRVFAVGEILEIKGSKFRVEKIKTRSLRLLLLPDE